MEHEEDVSPVYEGLLGDAVFRRMLSALCTVYSARRGLVKVRQRELSASAQTLLALLRQAVGPAWKGSEAARVWSPRTGPKEVKGVPGAGGERPGGLEAEDGQGPPGEPGEGRGNPLGERQSRVQRGPCPTCKSSHPARWEVWSLTADGGKESQTVCPCCVKEVKKKHAAKMGG